jgi:hypothetical protein
LNCSEIAKAKVPFRRLRKHYNPAIDAIEIIQTIDAEIARLEKARAVLNGQTASLAKRVRPFGPTVATKTAVKPRRKMSA